MLFVFAIIETGGKQYKVSEGDIIFVEKLEAAEGETVTIDKVLAFYGDKDAQWLSQLTHMEEPWRKARAGCADGEICTNTITKESMAIYYGGL